MTDHTSKNGQMNSSDELSDDPVQVPPQVYAQLEALRKSGAVNMFTEVIEGLVGCGFDEAREWIEANPEAYTTGFSVGIEPTDPDAVDPIDPDTLAISDIDDRRQQERDDASTTAERHLLNHLNEVRRFADPAAEYYAEGEWCNVASLNNEERELFELFDSAVDCQPQQAYRNALLAAGFFGENYDVEYVEGYAMDVPLTSPVEHAWVELDGKVIELTFPEKPQPTEQAAYLGIEYPLETVKEQIFEEGIAELLADNYETPTTS